MIRNNSSDIDNNYYEKASLSFRKDNEICFWNNNIDNKNNSKKNNNARLVGLRMRRLDPWQRSKTISN